MKNNLFEALTIALPKTEEFSHSAKDVIQDCIQDANLLLEGKELLLVKADENKTFFWLYAEAILIHKNHFKHDRRSTSLDIKHEAGHDYNVKDDAESKSTDLNELDNFFRAISDLDIQIIRMNHLDGYSLKEIAIKLGKPAKMIEKRHERAMQILTAAGTRERERERERETKMRVLKDFLFFFRFRVGFRGRRYIILKSI